ncbi:MAG TPA: hypothetical protein VFT05_10440 [Burkholderiaceae bacterium]|jgi:hypothetical protein|nr:hypothetical protein [Burkholderiaceae bacterium]
MDTATEQYKGFTIVVTPVRDHDDLWDFSYRITKTGQGGQDGDPAAAISRAQSAGGHTTEDAARVAGLEVARTEVDNLLALSRQPST